MGDRVGYPTVLRDRPCDTQYMFAFAGCCIIMRRSLSCCWVIAPPTQPHCRRQCPLTLPHPPSPPPGGSLRARPVSPGGGAGRRVRAVQLGGGPPRCRAPRRRADRDAQPVRFFYVHVFCTSAVSSLHTTVPCIGMPSFLLPGQWRVECRPHKWLRCGWLPIYPVLERTVP